MPLGGLINVMASSFEGARLFRGADPTGDVYLADFSPFPSRPDFGGRGLGGFNDRYFLSHDKQTFRQLKILTMDNGLVYTDTPGFIPLLISFQALEPSLVFENPRRRPGVVKPNMEIVHMTARRISADDELRNGLFYYFAKQPF